MITQKYSALPLYEQLSALSDASFFLNLATKEFMRELNNAGCYNDEMANRIHSGLTILHEMMDEEHQAILASMEEVCHDD